MLSGGSSSNDGGRKTIKELEELLKLEKKVLALEKAIDKEENKTKWYRRFF